MNVRASLSDIPKPYLPITKVDSPARVALYIRSEISRIRRIPLDPLPTTSLQVSIVQVAWLWCKFCFLTPLPIRSFHLHQTLQLRQTKYFTYGWCWPTYFYYRDAVKTVSRLLYMENRFHRTRLCLSLIHWSDAWGWHSGYFIHSTHHISPRMIHWIDANEVGKCRLGGERRISWNHWKQPSFPPSHHHLSRRTLLPHNHVLRACRDIDATCLPPAAHPPFDVAPLFTAHHHHPLKPHAPCTINKRWCNFFHCWSRWFKTSTRNSYADEIQMCDCIFWNCHTVACSTRACLLSLQTCTWRLDFPMTRYWSRNFEMWWGRWCWWCNNWTLSPPKSIRRTNRSRWIMVARRGWSIHRRFIYLLNLLLCFYSARRPFHSDLVYSNLRALLHNTKRLRTTYSSYHTSSIWIDWSFYAALDVTTIIYSTLSISNALGRSNKLLTLKFSLYCGKSQLKLPHHSHWKLLTKQQISPYTN